MTDTQRKVFIANYQDKDFAPANEFGEPIFVTQCFVPLHNMTKVRSSLKKFVDLSSQHDYLILNGPSVIVLMLGLLWFAKHGYVNVLSWDNKNTRYRHFVLGLESIVESVQNAST